MARILVTVKNVEQHIHQQTGTLYVGRRLILSPGARDYLQNQGVTISYDEGPQEPDDQQGPAAPASSAGQEMSPLVERIIAILRDEFQITEQQKLQDLCLQIVRKINT